MDFLTESGRRNEKFERQHELGMHRQRWRKVKPDRLTLTDTKTGPKHVLLAEATQELLDGLAETTVGEWVFPDDKRNEPLSTDDLWRFWIKGRDPARIVADARLHDLRHTAAMWS